METLYFREIESPLGPLTLMGTKEGLREVVYGRFTTKRDRSKNLILAEKQLNAYFKGSLKEFTVPLDLIGTPFQLKVWNELEKIPYGQTCSYLDIAKGIGDPKAVRAVGGANGRNPVPIILPCHRVIGKLGRLIGYSGGVNKKIRLLELEGAILDLA
ncbi:MAG: methylated-DNA--[protein]-cysteine S-methyltransferase [Flavobacteriales bacterium]|nr:methylated-DNA--[protein]-cysteine S-methyltransferase [Flavobacteriales bacterium]